MLSFAKWFCLVVGTIALAHSCAALIAHYNRIPTDLELPLALVMFVGGLGALGMFISLRLLQGSDRKRPP